ncbi:MAG: hypothetical protein HYZ72_13870 [Deltaproteobacteria bacterium]|nr:hypothetical protein [Deltaproteobacteria bacterium]
MVDSESKRAAHATRAHPPARPAIESPGYKATAVRSVNGHAYEGGSSKSICMPDPITPAELAGVTRWDIQDRLKECGIPIPIAGDQSAREMDELAEQLAREGIL